MLRITVCTYLGKGPIDLGIIKNLGAKLQQRRTPILQLTASIILDDCNSLTLKKKNKEKSTSIKRFKVFLKIEKKECKLSFEAKFMSAGSQKTCSKNIQKYHFNSLTITCDENCDVYCN